MGNLGSILNMLSRIGVHAVSSSRPEVIEAADKLILPGVGAFDTAIANIENGGLREPLNKKVLRDGVPVLGICLGMQLFTRRSEEGKLPGLGWIKGDTVKFLPRPNIRLPHMGWNSLEVNKHEHPLYCNMYEEPRFYFVHSYHVVCDDVDDVLATSEYGYRFAASCGRGNIQAVQFHPEKSHKFGIRILTNFVNL
jgi:glutamine amidotransferase